MSRDLTIGLDPLDSRADALRFVAKALEEEGMADARSDARFLLLHALSIGQTELALAPDKAIGADAIEPIDEAIRRRRSGEPVARILGEWEFWSLPFELSPRTLVPRPDTETLVEVALAAMPSRLQPLRILDLGTGSGCILVALLSERPNAFGIGTDLSLDALHVARRNAERNNVIARAAFLRGDWCAALRGPFDLIVSNPPYVASGAMSGLAIEVRCHEPRAALDGGLDGLDAYRAILGRVCADPGQLAAGGALLFEVGYDQAGSVRQLGIEAGLTRPSIARDLAGHERVVTLRPPSAAKRQT